MLKRVIIDPRIKGKHSDLIEQPVVIRLNKFNEESAENFWEDMCKAHETGQPVIPIIVDSYGGHAYTMLGMISEIQNAKLPIATIIESKAMSAGAILFAFGTEGMRYISPHATVMIHDVSSMQFGKVEDLKADADESDRVNNLIFRLMAKHCGHKNEDYFLDIIHEQGHADWFLTAKEAKKHNLANHIKIPELTIKVNFDFKFG